MQLTPVVIESPFAGDQQKNLRYLRAVMRECLTKRGEAPFASHGLYTQPGVLNDLDPAERKLGMRAGFEWGAGGKAVIVYTDLGITPGMMAGIEVASARGQRIEFRQLGTWEG